MIQSVIDPNWMWMISLKRLPVHKCMDKEPVPNKNKKLFSLLIMNTACDNINSRTFVDKFDTISVTNLAFQSRFHIF